GGLTRITDKRRVRRDHADVLCTTEEGIKGRRAVEWRLVDELAAPSALEAAVVERAKAFAASSNRSGETGIALSPLQVTRGEGRRDYGFVSVVVMDRIATVTLRGPTEPPPQSAQAMMEQGAAFWPLRLARELDDAILDLR